MFRQIAKTLAAKSLAPLLVGFAALAGAPAFAATVYETATYTGADTGDYTVTDGRSIGVAFSLSHATNVTAIGAQFGADADGDIFAAIVPLASLSAYPAGDAGNLAAIDVAHTVFAVPQVATAIDLTQTLSVTLQKGDYALIFGSGQYGATGSAGLGDLNTPLRSPALFQTVFDDTWQPQGDTGIRMFVEGVSAVPEPATWAMMIVGFGMIGAGMRYRRGKATAAFG